MNYIAYSRHHVRYMVSEDAALALYDGMAQHSKHLLSRSTNDAIEAMQDLDAAEECYFGFMTFEQYWRHADNQSEPEQEVKNMNVYIIMVGRQTAVCDSFTLAEKILAEMLVSESHSCILDAQSNGESRTKVEARIIHTYCQLASSK